MSGSSWMPTLGSKGEGWVIIQFVLLWLEVAVGVNGLGNTMTDGAPRLVMALAGSVAIASGGLLAVRGGRDLRDALTPLPHPRDHASLVETGVYRLVRHPIYGGIVIMSLGWGLVTASAAAILGAAVLLGFFRLKSGVEEVWLSQRYPEYATYRARTRRMLPFLY